MFCFVLRGLQKIIPFIYYSQKHNNSGTQIHNHLRHLSVKSVKFAQLTTQIFRLFFFKEFFHVNCNAPTALTHFFRSRIVTSNNLSNYSNKVYYSKFSFIVYSVEIFLSSNDKRFFYFSVGS